MRAGAQVQHRICPARSQEGSRKEAGQEEGTHEKEFGGSARKKEVGRGEVLEADRTQAAQDEAQEDDRVRMELEREESAQKDLGPSEGERAVAEVRAMLQREEAAKAR